MMNSFSRGLVCYQQVRSLTLENIIRDPDMRQAVGALGMLGGAIHTRSYLTLDQCQALITLSTGNSTFNVDDVLEHTFD